MLEGKYEVAGARLGELYRVYVLKRDADGVTFENISVQISGI